MRVLAMHCTGPCSDRPPGSQVHCAKTRLVPYGIPALPDPEAGLSPELTNRLRDVMRQFMCAHVDASQCQMWVGELRSPTIWAERIIDELCADGIPDSTATRWVQSVLDDPHHVPDELVQAMASIGNNEALHRLVAACIDSKQTPVYRLHQLSEAAVSG